MISREICQRVLHKAVSTGADYAEIFAENTVNHSISMIADHVDAVRDTVVAGASIRLYKGLRSVMSTTVDTSESGLMRCAEKAAEALGQGSAQIDIVLKERLFGDIHPVKVVPCTASNAEKVAILKDGYFAAKEYHESITQVQGGLADVDHNILIANSEGLYTQDRQIRTRMMISAVAEMNGETQTGGANPGRRMGLEMFDLIDPRNVGIHAAKQAVTMAGAGYCPAKVMPVAIENGFGGVIFHEACGHSLEASSVAYGLSQFAGNSLEATSVGVGMSQMCGKLGKQVANPKVTAIDDGTIPNAWGSCNIDDEGEPMQRRVLIENGILKGYMIDRQGERRMGMKNTASGRRQSYAHETTSRMTNTFIDNGPDKNEDIIASIENGIYCASMGGGSVNPFTGDFNFAASEAYLVKNGKICEPVKGASLIGNGGDVIMNIDMVGQDLDTAQGMCGSTSGMVPTDVGQPLIRVREITVGGQA